MTSRIIVSSYTHRNDRMKNDVHVCKYEHFSNGSIYFVFVSNGLSTKFSTKHIQMQLQLQFIQKIKPFYLFHPTCSVREKGKYCFKTSTHVHLQACLLRSFRRASWAETCVYNSSYFSRFFQHIIRECTNTHDIQQ